MEQAPSAPASARRLQAPSPLRSPFPGAGRRAGPPVLLVNALGGWGASLGFPAEQHTHPAKKAA